LIVVKPTVGFIFLEGATSGTVIDAKNLTPKPFPSREGEPDW
jgi:hypothetical protein